MNANCSHLERQVMQRIKLPSSTLPKLILICGPCRTGTGSLATALGRHNSVRHVHIQPLKAFARQLAGGQTSTPLTFLKQELEIQSGGHFELIKDTLGPDPIKPAEWINSLEILLKLDFPPEKIIFIPTTRHPKETIASWKRMWQWSWEDFPFDGFNRSFVETRRLMLLAQSLHIEVIPYAHELLQAHGAEKLISGMCQKIGLDFSPAMVSWGDEDAYFTKTVKYDEPPKKWIVGALGRKSGGRGELVWKPIEQPLTAQERQFVLPRIQETLAVHQQILELAYEVLGL